MTETVILPLTYHLSFFARYGPVVINMTFSELHDWPHVLTVYMQFSIKMFDVQAHAT